MSSPRADFTATLLQSGQVLLAGGQTSATANTATADLFDPVTSSITPAGGMLTARSGHTATLLTTGKVLVTGGSGTPGGASLDSAEIYDPARSSWAPASSMAAARSHHAAVLLRSGKVLVAGGRGAGSNPTGAEIYDPASNSWTSAGGGSRDTRPFEPTVTRLSDGRVMIVGGSDAGAETVAADVELFDPSVGDIFFNRFHPLGEGRNDATATLLADGTVIIVGGQHSTNPAGAQSTTDIYDPNQDTCAFVNCSSFSVGPPMNVGHCNHTATLLQTGLLLVAGGQCGVSDSIAVSELYDPVAKKWWPAGQLGDPRGHHTAVLLHDGRVLAAGGVFPGGSIAANTEIYTPA